MQINKLFDSINDNKACKGMHQCGLGCCVPFILCCCPVEESLDYTESNDLAVHVCGRTHRMADLKGPYIGRFCDMITGNSKDLKFLEAPGAVQKYKALPHKAGKIDVCDLGCRGKMLQIDATEACGQDNLVAAIREKNYDVIEQYGNITRQEFYEIFMQAMLVLEEDLFAKLAASYAQHKGGIQSEYDLQSFRAASLDQVSKI